MITVCEFLKEKMFLGIKIRCCNKLLVWEIFPESCPLTLESHRRKFLNFMQSFEVQIRDWWNIFVHFVHARLVMTLRALSRFNELCNYCKVGIQKHLHYTTSLGRVRRLSLLDRLISQSRASYFRISNTSRRADTGKFALTLSKLFINMLNSARHTLRIRCMIWLTQCFHVHYFIPYFS